MRMTSNHYADEWPLANRSQQRSHLAVRLSAFMSELSASSFSSSSFICAHDMALGTLHHPCSMILAFHGLDFAGPCVCIGANTGSTQQTSSAIEGYEM